MLQEQWKKPNKFPFFKAMGTNNGKQGLRNKETLQSSLLRHGYGFGYGYLCLSQSSSPMI
jgi:hypothetical protein